MFQVVAGYSIDRVIQLQNEQDIHHTTTANTCTDDGYGHVAMVSWCESVEHRASSFFRTDNDHTPTWWSGETEHLGQYELVHPNTNYIQHRRTNIPQEMQASEPRLKLRQLTGLEFDHRRARSIEVPVKMQCVYPVVIITWIALRLTGWIMGGYGVENGWIPCG